MGLTSFRSVHSYVPSDLILDYFIAFKRYHYSFSLLYSSYLERPLAVYINLPVLGILYKWDHTCDLVTGLFQLA